MDKYDRLSRSLRLVTMLLILQLVLGMSVFLFVSIPKETTSFAGYMRINLILAAHMVLAFFLVIADFMAFFMAIHARIGNKYIFSAMLSLITIVLAGVSGIMYLMAGQMALYSYLMAAFMIISFACIGITTAGTRKAKS